MLEIYDEIPKDLLELVEDVMLDRRDDATERLLDYSEKHKSVKKKSRRFSMEKSAFARQNYPFFGKRNRPFY